MTVAEYQTPPFDLDDSRAHRRLIANALNLLMQGKSNNVLDVTLNTSAATTTVSDARISAFTVPVCVPANANAQAVSVPYRDYSTAVNGSMILNHANNGNTKTFKIILVG
tara:strand:+ start:432 stop:761 length:330 start_codon:yes stop_codon:yes gene_type:complete